jgi:hypothetical protein
MDVVGPNKAQTLSVDKSPQPPNRSKSEERKEELFMSSAPREYVVKASAALATSRSAERLNSPQFATKSSFNDTSCFSPVAQSSYFQPGASPYSNPEFIRITPQLEKKKSFFHSDSAIVLKPDHSPRKPRRQRSLKACESFVSNVTHLAAGNERTNQGSKMLQTMDLDEISLNIDDNGDSLSTMTDISGALTDFDSSSPCSTRQNSAEKQLIDLLKEKLGTALPLSNDKRNQDGRKGGLPRYISLTSSRKAVARTYSGESYSSSGRMRFL